ADCQLSAWLDNGPCSRSCGVGLQKQYRKVIRDAAVGGVSCEAFSLSKEVVCNPTPCPHAGFDPIAAGRFTGFDFDVSQYCDEPDLCARLEDVEAGHWRSEAAP
ncbi:unnamed protein product, partial [Polarella glacialis]